MPNTSFVPATKIVEAMGLPLMAVYRLADRGEIDSCDTRGDVPGGIKLFSLPDARKWLAKVRTLTTEAAADEFNDETGETWLWIGDAAKWIRHELRDLHYRVSKRVIQDYCVSACPAFGARSMRSRPVWVRYPNGQVKTRTYVPMRELRAYADAIRSISKVKRDAADLDDRLTRAEVRLVFPELTRDHLDRWSREVHPQIKTAVATDRELRLDGLGRVRKCIVYHRPHLAKLVKAATETPSMLVTVAQVESQFGVDREVLSTEVRAGRLRPANLDTGKLTRGKRRVWAFDPEDIKRLKSGLQGRGIKSRDDGGRFKKPDSTRRPDEHAPVLAEIHANVKATRTVVERTDDRMDDVVPVVNSTAAAVKRMAPKPKGGAGTGGGDNPDYDPVEVARLHDLYTKHREANGGSRKDFAQAHRLPVTETIAKLNAHRARLHREKQKAV